MIARRSDRAHAKRSHRRATRPGEVVLVVHGFMATRIMTAMLARRLKRLGYRVINFGYRSFLPSITHNGRQLRSHIEQLLRDPEVKQVHIVAHSMGSLLTRYALAGVLSERIGRIVMLCPPNTGSHVATALKPWLGAVLTPLCEMADTPDSLVNQLPCLQEREVGVIAAQSDFMVRSDSTHLPGEGDHIVVPGLHASILFSRAVVREVGHFLETGRFAHQVESRL
jgi:pimeloyl-ACP methyl ester carboxylesterase